MESNITPKAPPSGAANHKSESKQITVDVPEDRVEEFHAFFERFLAGPSGRGRRGRHGRHGHGHHGRHGHGQHGRGCGRRREDAQQPEQSTQTTEI